jgi:hypothetical protein
LIELCKELGVARTDPLRSRDTVSISVIIAKQESLASVTNIPINKTNQIEQPSFSNNTVTPPTQSALYKPSTYTQDYTDDLIKKSKDITNRFGSGFLTLIPTDSSVMINMISKDGVSNYPTPNSFVAPFPTTTSVTVTIQGISGISVSDGFYVKRLPFIFEQYGCFQVTSITEKIVPGGWTTTINGYFKMLNLTSKE